MKYDLCRQRNTKVIYLLQPYTQIIGNKKNPQRMPRGFLGREGLEPSTSGLKGHCSTTELPTHHEEYKTLHHGYVLEIHSIFFVHFWWYSYCHRNTINYYLFLDKIDFKGSSCSSHTVRSVISWLSTSSWHHTYSRHCDTK